MAVMNGRRAAAVVGAVVAVIAIIATVSPVSAQVPPGSQATVYVGGPVANCPPGSPGALVPVATTTVNGVTVSGAGRCTPLAADAEGFYSVGGSSPLNFTSECANVDGVVQSRSGVVVPAGSTVNGVLVTSPTTVTAENAVVVFPGGRTATLNVVTTTPTSVTRDAIVFGQGGPIVGRVVCGAAAYPLAVDTAGGSDVAAALPELPVADGDDGGISTALLAAGALALVVLAQVAVGRHMRRRGYAGA